LNLKPHEAQLEDSKSQEGDLIQGKAARPTKCTKSGKPSQNGKKELRKAKAQKYKKAHKLKNSKFPMKSTLLTLSMQALLQI
jgi:hypothetical protein